MPAYYLDNVTLEKANLSMTYMENAPVDPDAHKDGSFAPAVTLEEHGRPKPSTGMSQPIYVCKHLTKQMVRLM